MTESSTSPPAQSSGTNASNLSVVAATRGWEMFTAPTAPASRTLCIIGEAPGADEEKSGTPFVGSAGRQLTESFQSAGLDRSQWFILNTFLKRPPDNNLSDPSWTLNKTDFKREYGYVPSTPALKKRYLRPEHQWQIEELQHRLHILKPDLILAMGATALWALTGADAITQHRGNFTLTPFGRALPTLHPASVLYQYSNLPLLWADLVKVRLWLEGKLPAPMRRKVWFNPTFDEIGAVYARFAALPEDTYIGVDIETCPSIAQITTISFATAAEGICIPFWDRYALSAAAQNYWKTVAEEIRAWRWVDRYARLAAKKVMQNGLYDSQYLMDAPIDIRLNNWRDDTALMQHSYQPELPKALGVLGSLYLNEPSWKQMRANAADNNKADE